MIQFENWTISAPCGEVIARQYDNLSRTLTVMGDLPAGWDWSMLVESGGNLNIISLSPVDGGVGVTLTADMIPYAGYYRMQLRGTQGEAVRHTNILTQVYIPPSLTGEGQWPDLPSEFGQIEERMQELAGQAQDSADAADTSAKAAAESAAAAQGAEESVAANAKAAQDAANAAQTSEGNAKTSETNAAKSAGDAQTSAGQAADSATQAKTAQGKAEAAQQAIEDLEVSSETLEPDSPASVEKTVSPEGVVTLEFGIPMGPQGPSGVDAPQINDAIITDANPWSAKKIVDTLAPPLEASGAVVMCNPVADYPLEITSQITAVQPGTGNPSFENVRTISGWTAATARLCGKNLLGLSSAKIGYAGEYDKKAVTTISGNTVTWRGIYGDTAGGRIVFPVPVNVPITIKFSSSDVPMSVNIAGGNGVDENDLILDLGPQDSFTPGIETTGTYTSTKPYVALSVTPKVPGGTTSTDFIAYVGTEDQAYVPFDPASTEITLPFGQTVYGGTLDWQSGVLTITYAMADMSTFNWTKYKDRTNVYGFFCVPPNAANHSYFLAKSDKLRYFSSVANGVEGFGNGDVSNRLYVLINKTRLPDNTVDSFEAFLAENPVTFVYLLASPTTVQLTPQEMLALSDENTIYTDTGDTTVSGRADPNTILQQLAQRIAALEGQAING